MTQRLWRDGWLGLANVDLARFRYELFAGVHARRQIAALGADRFDVLHFHRQAVAYGSLDLMARTPTVVSVDCTQDCVIDAAGGALERATYQPNVAVDGAIFRRAAAIIITSRWAAGCLARRYPDCQTPVHVMPNPVLLRHFSPEWLAERGARAAAGERPRAVFMGGDFPRKGGYDLLEAWAAGALHEHAVLEIVTDWPVGGTLPPGVTITRGLRPHTAAWSELWRRADLFVMPTRNEAFGLVFQEAAAAGVPAIGTRHNAVPEIVLDGETGVLVGVGNVPELTAALRLLAMDAGLRLRMGARARDVIEERADPTAYMAKLTAILQAAAGRSPGLR